MNYLKSTLIVAAIVVVVAMSLTLNGTTLRKTIFSQAIPTDYFSAFGHIEASLYPVSGEVYAFEDGFTRSMVLRTPEGIAIFDTFSKGHAEAMRTALEQQFPGEPVRWVIFSHHHLDHIRGSDQFPEAEIIGHETINQLVSDWPDAGESITPVTHVMSGDTTLNLGGVTVEAMYMPFSHSHTLYGFYIPAQNVVYAPDMMFVKALPPFDFPDFYYPGYVRALDRIIAVDAAHYVPSHMDRGTRDDLIAFRNMTVEFQEVVKTEVLSRGAESAVDGEATREALQASYDQLQPKYGDWHGFDAMFVPKFGRHLGGTYLGY